MPEGAPPLGRDAASLRTIVRTVAMLHDNGQSTDMALVAAQRLARGLGQPATVIVGWASVAGYDPSGRGIDPIIEATDPTGINMRRVGAVMRVVDEAEDGAVHRDRVEATLAQATALPGPSTPAFVAACSIGAAALAVVFGASDPHTIAAAAAAAGAGAVVRKMSARLSVGPILPVLIAALIAGIAGSIATAADLATAGLAAVCPAMVMVPGPQILIAAMDLLACRVSLGVARLTHAGLILATIAAGLIVGLHLGGQSLSQTSTSIGIPVTTDVVAAGIAAACYPVFFSMPYRYVAWPVVVGMAAHAMHWWAVSQWHLGLPVAALLSCLLTGIILTPITYLQRIPFTAVGFAAVVALVPGVYVFRAVAGLVRLVSAPTPQLMLDIAANGATAASIVAGMAVGLVIPTQVRDRLLAHRAREVDPTSEGPAVPRAT